MQNTLKEVGVCATTSMSIDVGLDADPKHVMSRVKSPDSGNDAWSVISTVLIGTAQLEFGVLLDLFLLFLKAILNTTRELLTL